MSFSRVYSIFVNTSAGPNGALLRSLASGLEPAPEIVWVANDIFELRVRYGVPGPSSLNPVALADMGADAFLLAGKAADNLSADHSLFSLSDFTKVTVGEDVYYSGTLDLSSDLLKAAVVAADGSLKCKVDLKDENGDATSRLTLPQFNVTILQPAFMGTESGPETGDPVWPALGFFQMKADKGEANGFAGLDGDGKVPAAQLQEYATATQGAKADSALQDPAAFATAAQGAKADSALQDPAAFATAAQGAKADSALQDATAFATAAQGAKADSSLQWSAVPAAATDPGAAGQLAYDAAYLYLCVAANTWVRTAIATW